jgi:hypothetical protein
VEVRPTVQLAGISPSEHCEREGEAPSGSANESEDRASPVRARGVGASEERSPARAPADNGGDASPYYKKEISLC